MSKDSNEPNDTEKRKYTTPSKSPMVAQVSAVAYEILDNAVFHINKPTITARAEVIERLGQQGIGTERHRFFPKRKKRPHLSLNNICKICEAFGYEIKITPKSRLPK